MISLSNQLRDDLEELFRNNENYPEYKDIIVKKQYEKYPKITYPIISIQELNNEDVLKYRDDDGEEVTYLGYQIRIDSEQTENHTALENVEIIGELIDEYLKGERYWCLRRIGNFAKYPMQNDDNVMVGYLRYECNVDIKTNTIYRR